ncbi:phage antirepressor KilAC domain-containing protein [Zymobacter sp. IVIA_12111.31 C1]|uniref:phage antirepressor KilAC domain-containing protein n=1 Tax=Zymobacter sp. IVIA_12111.31 C1 TaxID=3394854 RepID=UPI0039C04D9F
MNNLITHQLTMTSRDIAELTGSRHDNVKRTIVRLAEQGAIQLPPLEEKPVTGGRPGALYVFSGDQGRLDSITVVAQLCPTFTSVLVRRWDELERQVAKPALPDFSNPVAAARAWADAEERRLLVQQQLEEAKPKAEFVDRYVNVGTGSKTFRQVAKLLDAKERDLRQFLQDRRVMYRLNGEWVAYQQHIDADRFETRTSQAENGHVFNQAKFTPKGVAWIAELWNKRNEVAAA